jgi:hypothetical protein
MLFVGEVASNHCPPGKEVAMALNRGRGEPDDLEITCKAVGFLALLTALFYLWSAMDQGLGLAGLGSVATDGWLAFTLMAVGVLGLLAAWRYRRAGGALAALSGALLCVFVYTTGANRSPVAALAYSSPFIIAGLLFVLAGCRRG